VRLVLQRVLSARVEVDGELLGEIGTGLVVLVAFGQDDDLSLQGTRPWRAMQDKILNLRVFPDEQGKLNLSLVEVGGDLLLVSQFTLYADCRKGRRPSFTSAAPPDTAQSLYHRFCEELRARAPGRTATGEFGAEMHVTFTNWGPVTIQLDSADFSRR